MKSKVKLECGCVLLNNPLSGMGMARCKLHHNAAEMLKALKMAELALCDHPGENYTRAIVRTAIDKAMGVGK